jgi:hypothetical protein
MLEESDRLQRVWLKSTSECTGLKQESEQLTDVKGSDVYLIVYGWIDAAGASRVVLVQP